MFLDHSVKLSEAFQLVDAGSRKKRGGKKKNRSGNRTNVEDKQNEGTKKNTKELPLCLYEPHKQRGFLHMLRDCRDCPDEEKKRLLSELAAQKAKDGPSRSTRFQQSTTRSIGSSFQDDSTKSTAGRISCLHNLPGCSITLSDSNTSIECHGR